MGRHITNVKYVISITKQENGQKNAKHSARSLRAVVLI